MIEGIEMVQLTKGIVIVDRSHVFGKPDYCIHGESFCVGCDHAVWLGDKTVEVVKTGVAPVCTECATEMRADGRLPSMGPIKHVEDHRRADGPHT